MIRQAVSRPWTAPGSRPGERSLCANRLEGDTISTRLAAQTVRTRIKRVIPAFVLDAAHDCQGLPRRTRVTYLRLRLGRALRLRSDRAKLRHAPRSLLFVCHGNVMRSPVAAELFRARAAAHMAFDVESAGTWTTDGRLADPRAVVAAGGLGISLESHRSRIDTTAMVERADIICVMDYRNEAEVVHGFPRRRGRRFCSVAWTGSRSGRRLPTRTRSMRTRSRRSTSVFRERSTRW